MALSLDPGKKSGWPQISENCILALPKLCPYPTSKETMGHTHLKPTISTRPIFEQQGWQNSCSNNSNPFLRSEDFSRSILLKMEFVLCAHRRTCKHNAWERLWAGFEYTVWGRHTHAEEAPCSSGWRQEQEGKEDKGLSLRTRGWGQFSPKLCSSTELWDSENLVWTWFSRWFWRYICQSRRIKHVLLAVCLA